MDCSETIIILSVEEVSLIIERILNTGLSEKLVLDFHILLENFNFVSKCTLVEGCVSFVVAYLAQIDIIALFEEITYFFVAPVGENVFPLNFVSRHLLFGRYNNN